MRDGGTQTPHEWRPLGVVGTVRFLAQGWRPRFASWRHFGFELSVEIVRGSVTAWIERAE